MNLKIFTVEYAPTSICECDFCEDKIIKKDLRIAQLLDTTKVRRILIHVVFKEEFIQIFLS